MVKIKKARYLIKLFMKIMKFKYLALPKENIYYLYEYPSQRYIRHERKHLEQYKRDGVIKYFFVWWYEYFTKGYDNISYEVEAVKCEKEK